MIVPMMKYSLVVYHREYEAFLEQLQELGLVDITTSAWEPTTDDRALMATIENYRKAVIHLKAIGAAAKADQRKNAVFSKNKQPAEEGSETKVSPLLPTTKELGSAEKAFTLYTDSAERIADWKTRVAKTEKEVADLRPWGAFSHNHIRQLEEAGVQLHFYNLFIKEYETGIKEWKKHYAVQEISRNSLTSHFVIVTPVGEVPHINVQEVKLPNYDYLHKTRELNEILDQIRQQEAQMARCYSYLEDFEEEIERLSNRLHLREVSHSGKRQAQDTLIIMEGWATAETQEKVDAALDASEVFYIKEAPTEEDVTPVLLKNNRFISLFEFIGNFYALPKYGTTDLTPYFGPFYALFFGFCLGDAGYGLLYVLAGLFMALKIKKSMTPIGWLVVCCGAGSILFGLLTGNIFGIQLADMKVFSSMKELFFTPNVLFVLSIGVGLFTLLFGMSIRVVGIAKRQGIRHTFGTLGWMIVIISSLAAFLLPEVGVEGYSTSSPVFFVLLGIGLFMMFFLNSPGKNPFFNFGAGLWNTFNDITGLMSDTLSYIRLFALSLSGGVMGMVFNDLASGLSPNIPVLRQLIMLIILLIGHGITLFMSSLSSFVHPMRLTFVEFYKNAGFEATHRPFRPLRKTTLKNNSADASVIRQDS